MFTIDQQTRRRALISTAAVLGLLAPLFGLPYLESLFGAPLACAWLHDHVWLPTLGYGFYWGAPWSQVGAATLGVIFVIWWAAWLFDAPVLALPGFLCSWIYLGYVQPSGALLLFFRRWEVRLLLRVRGVREEARNGPRPLDGSGRTSRGFLVTVADALTRQAEERVRAAGVTARTGDGTGAFDDEREAASARLLFLAKYHAPELKVLALAKTEDLERCAVYLFRALTHAGEARDEIEAYLGQVLEAYYQKQVPDLGPSQDAPVLALGGSHDQAQPILRSIPVLDLLKRHERTAGTEWLAIAAPAIRQALAKVWEISQTLDSVRLGTVPPFQLGELRRDCHRAARRDLIRFGLGDVVESWLRALWDGHEFPTMARAAQIAPELASPKLERHLETIEKLPWPGPDRELLTSLLVENRIERPEAVRFLSARAWLALADESTDEAFKEFSLDQALADGFERGDVEWMMAAENLAVGRSSD